MAKEKQYNSETVRLEANEKLMNDSKAFVMFYIDKKGDLSMLQDVNSINSAEYCGLETFVHRWVCGDLFNEGEE